MSRGALPEGEYERPPVLLQDERGMVARIRPEGGGPAKDYIFSRLKLGSDLTASLAAGFARAAGTGGGRRSIDSIDGLFASLRAYATHLNTFPTPPKSVAELDTAHIAELRLRGTKYSVTTVHAVRSCLRGEAELPEQYRQLLFAPLKSGDGTGTTVESYSEAQFRQIRRSARMTVRAALKRIRGLRTETEQWRRERRAEDIRGVQLDHLSLHGGVPRYASGAVRRSNADVGVATLATELFPSLAEIAAAATLMICVSGQNLSTVRSLTDEYHRADGQQILETDRESTKVVITDTIKPRRGRYAAEQDSVLISRPPAWLGMDSLVEDDEHDPRDGGDDYASPYGVYLIIEELCREARFFSGTRSLFCGFSAKRMETTTNELGFRPLAAYHLSAWNGDLTGSTPRPVATGRLRKAFVEMTQRPVDHKQRTLARDYLSRDRTALPAYQDVVHGVLSREAGRIRATHAIRFLSHEQVNEAIQEPEVLAAKFEITVPVLEELLSGALDTVAAACVDNTHSPHSAAGVACTASFLLCLGCPCARSEPRHIPVQAALSLELEDRRRGMDDEAWDARFGVAQERLVDLLTEQRVDVRAAAAMATSTQIDAVHALLDGRLEIR